MSIDDDPRREHIESSFFMKAFSLVGAFIAVTAIATLIAFSLIAVNKWYRYEYSIFGLTWGLCARWLDLSVRQGIKQSLASRFMTTKGRKILGEQLAMLRITRRFVRAELVASAILFIVELLMR